MKKLLLMMSLMILFTGIQAQEETTETELSSQELTEKFGALLNLIETQYAVGADIDKLTEQAIVKVLAELDPHSTYISAKNVKKENEPLVGDFEGVGIQFNILRDSILVVTPISGGPSEKVGIRAGDKIVEIDGENVASVEMTNRGVIDRLRGKKGTVVQVGIQRRGAGEMLYFEITRDKIPLFSVDASYMVTPDIGYIKINRFSNKTVREFEEALAKLKSQGMKSLVLDLQGNGGGVLAGAIGLADNFLSSGKMIVYTEGKNSPKQEFKSTVFGGFENGNLAILVNEGSASASEIVSGAIQDWDRGIIVGRRSWGKGMVQRPYQLPDGSVVRLTVSNYYTHSGRCIQRPYEQGKEDYYKEFERRLTSGELMVEDSLAFPDSLIFETEGGRVVYGSGGITPDIFVPLDTSMNSEYYSKLVRKGILNGFTLDYVDAHRDELLAAHADAFDFKNNFVLDKDFMKAFFEFAEGEGVEYDEEGYEHSQFGLHTQIKGLIARNLWDSTAYFIIANDLNDSLNKAIEALEDNKMMAELGINY